VIEMLGLPTVKIVQTVCCNYLDTEKENAIEKPCNRNPKLF